MHGSATLPKHLLVILSIVLAVTAQHDHGHSQHGEAKTEWDEEDYLRMNPPTPPSYWSEDTRMRMSSDEELPARYPWLMVLHILFMSAAFFVALPAGECVSHHALCLTLSAGPTIPGPTRETCGGSSFPFPTPTSVPITRHIFDPRSGLLILISIG